MGGLLTVDRVTGEEGMTATGPLIPPTVMGATRRRLEDMVIDSR